MQKNKLIHILKTLSRKERRLFNKYLHHADVHRKAQLITLYSYLWEHIDKLDPLTFDRDQTFQKLYTANDSPSHPRVIVSGLCLLLETFLAQEELKLHPEQHQYLLLEAFRKRQLDTLFFKSTVQLNQQLSERADLASHRYRHQLQEAIYFHPETDKFSDIQSIDQLKTATLHLDYYYYRLKLRHICELLLDQWLRGTTFSSEALNRLLAPLQQSILCEDAIIALYLSAIHLFQNPSLTAYHDLKVQVLHQITQNETEDKLYLLGLAINSANIVLGDTDKLPEIFSLYQAGLSQDVFLDNNRFSPDNFNNILSISCGLGHFDWAKQFIRDYIEYLANDRKSRKNIEYLFQAQVHFWQQEYRKVIPKLNDLVFDDFSYGIRAHSLLIRSWYEYKTTKAQPTLNTFCVNYKVYLHRKFRGHYVSGVAKEAQLNFVKFARKLPDAAGRRYARIAKESLKKQIVQTDNVAFRDWLLQKIAQLP